MQLFHHTMQFNIQEYSSIHDCNIIKQQLFHHVLQFQIQILLSITVNNQKLTDGRTIPKYRDAIASKKS